MLVGVDKVLEYILEVTRRIFEFDKRFTKVGEAVGNAHRVVRDHSAKSFKGLDLLITNTNIAKRKAPGLHYIGQAERDLLWVNLSKPAESYGNRFGEVISHLLVLFG